MEDYERAASLASGIAARESRESELRRSKAHEEDAYEAAEEEKGLLLTQIGQQWEALIQVGALPCGLL